MFPVRAIIKIIESEKSLKEIIRDIFSEKPIKMNQDIFDRADKELKDELNGKKS